MNSKQTLYFISGFVQGKKQLYEEEIKIIYDAVNKAIRGTTNDSTGETK